MSDETEVQDSTSHDAGTHATESSQPIDNSPAQQSETHVQPQKSYAPYVDLSTLPDDIRAPIEARFRHMSQMMKRNEVALNEYRGVAQSQSEKIAELMNGVGTVVDHLQAERFTDTEQTLLQQMQTAYERGDSAGVVAAQDKLIDVRTQKRLFEKEQKERKPAGQQIQQPIRTPSALETAEQAAMAGEIAPEEVRGIEVWQNEKDASGSLLRPWAHNRSSDPRNPDPQYIQALMESRAVFTNNRFANLTMEQKLAEVDRRMGVQVRQSSQSVIGANLTNGKRSAKITLSPKQEEIAVRTKFGGSKAKSDADHIEAYRKQIELVNNSRKGARP